MTHSFPTRRCSDLRPRRSDRAGRARGGTDPARFPAPDRARLDRELDPAAAVALSLDVDGDDCTLAADKMGRGDDPHADRVGRSEENTSELQSLMRISYAVVCLKKKKKRRED